MLVVAGALFAVAGGVVYATIPDGNHVYTACMKNNSGRIRLIDPSLPPTKLMSHCVGTETQITWNQDSRQPGPTGPAGVKGDRGPTGLRGPAGVTGLPGARGATGHVGTTGLTGHAGPSGATGLRGLKGDKGDKGDKGSTGTTGAQGLPGSGGASSLAGSVTFIDPADTTGFSGLGDQQNTATTAANAASVIGSAGTIGGLRGHLGAAASPVTLTLFVNGAATSVTCTFAGLTCADATHTAAVSAGDVVAVRITNGSGGALHHLSWSATLS